MRFFTPKMLCVWLFLFAVSAIADEQGNEFDLRRMNPVRPGQTSGEVDLPSRMMHSEEAGYDFTFENGVFTIEHFVRNPFGFGTESKRPMPTSDDSPLLTLKVFVRGVEKPTSFLIARSPMSISAKTSYKLGTAVERIEITPIEIDTVQGVATLASNDSIILENKNVDTSAPLSLIGSKYFRTLDIALGNSDNPESYVTEVFSVLAPDDIRIKSHTAGKVARAYYKDDSSPKLRVRGYYKFKLIGEQLEVTHFINNSFIFGHEDAFFESAASDPDYFTLQFPRTDKQSMPIDFMLDAASHTKSAKVVYRLPFAPNKLNIHVGGKHMLSNIFDTRPNVLFNSLTNVADQYNEALGEVNLFSEDTLAQLAAEKSSSVEFNYKFKKDSLTPTKHGGFMFSLQSDGVIKVTHRVDGVFRTAGSAMIETPKFPVFFEIRAGSEMQEVKLTPEAFSNGVAYVKMILPSETPSIDIELPVALGSVYFEGSLARLYNPAAMGSEQMPKDMSLCQTSFL